MSDNSINDRKDKAFESGCYHRNCRYGHDPIGHTSDSEECPLCEAYSAIRAALSKGVVPMNWNDYPAVRAAMEDW